MTTGAPDLLEAIVAATEREVSVRQDQVSIETLEQQAATRTPRGEAFRTSLMPGNGFNIIAECKRRSPSRGVLRADYRPAEIARAYTAAGATAISVLTEPAFFDGALEDLANVRAAVEIPVLRKDFVVSRYQLLEARAAGADAVLLIVAALEDQQLESLHEAALGQGLAVLVEVHDTAELSQALDAGARIIGVNNRNLRTLDVDLNASHTLIANIPKTVLSVAESGLRRGGDLVALREAGYDAFLIGESLITAEDPGRALRALLVNAAAGVARPR